MGRLKVKVHHAILTAFLFGFVFIVISSVFFSEKQESANATTPACSPSYNVSLMTISDTATNVANGMMKVVMTTSYTPVAPVDRVMFFMDSSFALGRSGPQNGSSPYTWSMIWSSGTSTVGAHTLSAEVYHGNGSVCTVTNTTAINVINSTAQQISTQVLPVMSWTGPTNNNMDFEVVVNIGGVAIELRQFMIFDWTTTIGSVVPAPSGYIGRFSSGPTAGSGIVKAQVRYGGQKVFVSIPVSVVSPPTTTTNTTTTGTNSTTPTTTTMTTPTTTTQTTTTSTTPTLTTRFLASDSTIRQCLLKSLSEERIKAIESEQSRPTAAEFGQYQICFAKRSFVVASTLAPVAPTTVKELKESKDIVISGAENKKDKIEGIEKEKLVFKGKGTPNSTVLIYVFSEPLVLATTTDDTGEWTYTLEDPMEPGSHEAYALVNKGDGTYQRSSPFGFLIGKAEASASNPQGYGLSLQIQPTASSNNRSVNMFVAGIIFVVVFSMTLVVFYLVSRAKTRSSKEPDTLSSSDITTPTSGVM